VSEQWLPVAGHEGYEISDAGRVRSWRIFRGQPGPRLRKLTVNPQGYSIICLDGTTYTVHRLVMEAFVGPRPSGADICHGDGVRTNAALSNLRYDSRAANMQDAIRHGTLRNGRADRTHCPQNHEYTEANTRVSAGARFCRACDRIKAAARRRQAKELAA
jgi:hypothetical protein